MEFATGRVEGTLLLLGRAVGDQRSTFVIQGGEHDLRIQKGPSGTGARANADLQGPVNLISCAFVGLKLSEGPGDRDPDRQRLYRMQHVVHHAILAHRLASRLWHADWKL